MTFRDSWNVCLSGPAYFEAWNTCMAQARVERVMNVTHQIPTGVESFRIPGFRSLNGLAVTSPMLSPRANRSCFTPHEES